MAEIVVNSGSINCYDYDSDKRVLTVTFKPSGSQYEYKNVTPSIVSAVFETGGSIGSKFYSLIKHGGFQASQI